MSHKPFGLLLAALFALVPASVFGQSSPRQGPEINAAELLASSTLDLPDPDEAAEFDKTFSQPFPINDGIQRNYILATDELYQPTANGGGQLLNVSGAYSPSALARAAEVLFLEYRLETRLVLYPANLPKFAENRKTVSRDVLVQTDNKEAAKKAAASFHLQLKSEPAYAPDSLVFTADSPAGALSAAAGMTRAGFSKSYPKLFRQGLTFYFLPNDPLFSNQWHIRGRGQNGAKKASDAKITPVWEQRSTGGSLIRGEGIRIGITDDGIEMTHPDLESSLDASLSYDWGTEEAGGDPVNGDDNHGTAVAGVAAATGYNGVGVSGAAPAATLVSQRIDFSNFTDQKEAETFVHGGSSIRIKNNSWGYQANAPSPVGELSSAAVKAAADNGTIIIFAAGNGLQNEDNTNFHFEQNSIYTLAVAASNDQGRQTDYSTPGASVIITAPSGGDVYGLSSSRPQGTSTTDRTGENGYNHSGSAGDYSDLNYTDRFNGTSSACPVASGVTALVLQANPSLNWRDVKEIYIRSATRNDSGESDWARNGAGFWFNHKYGAGLINASEAVRLAKNWSNLGAMTSVSIPLSSLPTTIRDNNASGSVKYFDTRSLSGMRVEHATVTTDISHPSRGELQIQLTSPAGTTSRLAEKHTSYPPDPADYPDWTFSTVHNWGEDSRGLWKLKIADRIPGNTGTLNSATLTLYGTAK